ncbi:transcriptional regulator, DeoR family [Thermoanaerobacter sp. YS13]|uniref:DeoR/GlpR family DNA-binding transcription regulator n=1 Tax=Thermoanaerobacter sp. YS13 TaxID=1511746 RepID=UPI000573CBB7|nr:DeoR/GlpR family DNA-binding transcription regulator [Thermoanaerobacter sp. YS13]KHO63034.1 transcriptional regulator, DeoR family [Thermoanaerobacter sp. YS13]
MNKAERIQKIFEILSSEGNASTKYLAEALGVSEATIRRDLINLSQENTFPFQRVRGGVIYSLEKSGVEPMFDLKLSQMVDEKKKIAKMALDLIEDGDSLFLDSGTTIYYLAKIIGSKKGLKVVTVDVKVAAELAKHPNIKTILAGGEVRSGYYSIGGDDTVNFLKQFRVEKAFLATDGWNIDGTFNSSNFEVGIKRKMIELSKKRYLLADHTKYGKDAFIKVSDLDVFDAIIMDVPLSDDIVGRLKDKGISIIF